MPNSVRSSDATLIATSHHTRFRARPFSDSGGSLATASRRFLSSPPVLQMNYERLQTLWPERFRDFENNMLLSLFLSAGNARIEQEKRETDHRYTAEIGHHAL